MPQNLKTILQKNFIFKNLTLNEIAKIDPYIQEINFPKNHVIIRQGDQGEGLYIIIDGTASVDAKLFSDMQVHIADIKSNDIIGEVTLIAKKGASATVTTTTPMRCFFIGIKYFNMLQLGFPDIEFKISTAIVSTICSRVKYIINQVAGSLDEIPEIHIKKRQKLAKVKTKSTSLTAKSMAKYLNLLGVLALFKIFAQEELHILKNYLNYIELPKNSVICQEGDLSNVFYIVIFGAIQVVSHKKNKIAKLRIAGPNNLVGELAFFDQQPSIVSNYVREDAKLIEITRDNLEKLHLDYPKIFYKLIHILYVSFGELLRISDSQFLRLQAQDILSKQKKRK